FVLASGMAFLISSVSGLSGLFGSSLNQPVASENPAQSQSAQFKAEEKGFLAVLKREPNNQTALRGLVEIRMRTGDAPGTKAALEQLVKLNPTNKEYKELLAAIDKQMAEPKKVGTLKPTEPKQPTQPAK
ncbi:tetratricopeptide repeat protein, partial [Chamaesiphon sp. OTE_20_metabat_361]|uniref:tetratricopeptide repeat protein n=1 Tax=Chamaesiphon sp. OTE_20_metabat_361 TaxID=2964689 RepID=UPI00286AD985